MGLFGSFGHSVTSLGVIPNKEKKGRLLSFIYNNVRQDHLLPNVLYNHYNYNQVIIVISNKPTDQFWLKRAKMLSSCSVMKSITYLNNVCYTAIFTLCAKISHHKLLIIPEQVVTANPLSALYWAMVCLLRMNFNLKVEDCIISSLKRCIALL